MQVILMLTHGAREQSPKYLVWSAVAILLYFAAFLSLSCGNPARLNTLDVGVAIGNTDLRVTNKGTAAAAGNEMIVYINGQPPNAYKQTATVPGFNAYIDLPLREFTKKDGERFDPTKYAVTEIWIGGGGFDYRSFKTGQ